LLKRFKPNYIHCHDVIALSVGLILKLRFNNIGIIYDAHELESKKNLISDLASKIIFAIERVATRSVDHLIVVNDSIAKWYRENLGFNKISVILNSPEVNKPIKFDPFYLRNKYNIEKNRKIFIYAGIFSENRGLRKISKIFSEDPNLGTLIFIGYGPLKEYLTSLNRNYSNIIVHERVSNKKLLEILSSADVGICLIENKSLSLYYSLPNKLFEYTASGIPIIASSFPEIEKAISILNNGVVCDPEDEDDIIKSIEKLDLSKNNINLEALKEMSWENQMIKLKNIYEGEIETEVIAK
jgi:glycosyltransferase involved in cell wall biosynthesis